LIGKVHTALNKRKNMETIGAGRHLTPDVTLRATRLVTRGKIYRLGQILSPDVPQLDDNPAIAHGRRFRVNRPAKARPGSGALSESIELSTHTGTHIDAFGHWYKDDCLLDGKGVEEGWTTTDGLRTLGLDSCPPLMTRGVLLDVAAFRSVEMLESGIEIKPEELESVAVRAGLEIQRGDVVLLRTGWSKLWARRDLRYIREEPGLGREGAEWLAGRGVVAIGADNWAIDAIPANQPRKRDVHEVCLAERGVYLIENLDLEELARERVFEFLFIALAPRLRGGTAFPIDPIAVI
jgi:kynurenine formamidase